MTIQKNKRVQSGIDYCFLIVGISLLLRLIFIAFNGLLVEEAYYWNYAEHLDFGYLDHPPMVALLIKASMLIFGLHEWSVHLPAMICWGGTAFFVFKLTELIARGAGRYSVMLFSILPFFFLQSVVITPDPAVMVCWSAALYYLYRVLVLDETQCWYVTGVWLGLGLLSKYTIVLLGLPIFAYLCIVPAARVWFTRKEPYLAVLIAALLFTPVIYWNATHEWASFVFQSVSRFNSPSSFSLHKFIGLLVFVLTPVGIWELWQLFRKSELSASKLVIKTQQFLQLFTLLPLAFFAFYGLTHTVKFDWIGPGLLAIIPWFAVLTYNALGQLHPGQKLTFKECSYNAYYNWLSTAVVFLVIYVGLILIITFGVPEFAHRKFLGRYFAWDRLTQEFNAVASQVEHDTHSSPEFAPLDAYNIGSELSFYQTLFFKQGKIEKIYPVVGRQIFGCNSLMYKYWFNGENLSGKTLILISTELGDFDIVTVKAGTIEKSPLQEIWSYSERGNSKIQPFYYKIVEMKP